MLRNILIAFVVTLGALWAQGASAQPVDYVKICDVYGAGWFYIPGSITCVHANTGETRTQTALGTVRGQTDIAKDAEEAASGAAAAAAMSRAYVETGHRFAIAGDVAKIDDTGAGSLGAALRLSSNLTVSGSAAFAEGDATATRAGFNLSW